MILFYRGNRQLPLVGNHSSTSSSRAQTLKPGIALTIGSAPELFFCCRIVAQVRPSILMNRIKVFGGQTALDFLTGINSNEGGEARSEKRLVILICSNWPPHSQFFYFFAQKRQFRKKSKLNSASQDTKDQTWIWPLHWTPPPPPPALLLQDVFHREKEIFTKPKEIERERERIE